MSNSIDQPMPFKRLFAGPAVADTVFTSAADMTAYLSDASRYAGQPAVLVVAGKDPVSYVLSADRASWVEAGGKFDDAKIQEDIQKLDTQVGAQADALLTKADLVGGKVPTSQLPGFIDEILEYPTLADFPAVGYSDKIYVALDTTIQYRWGGTIYTPISSSVALGETATTAYRGDRGKEAYDHTKLVGNTHGLTKADLGLDKVDNTPDLDKPVSSAVVAALAGKADLVGGSIPESQLPSYVDDVIELASLAAFPETGESGKIYFALDTNLPYRWGSTQYVPMSSGLSLGETASTAFRGDHGKVAYDHAQAVGNAHGLTKADLNLDKVDNTTDLGKPVSTATAAALAAKADLVNGLIPSNQLPSFVDDVLEFQNLASMPVIGESGKIYIAADTSITYRWSGTSYVSISSSVALGETAATAYRGDRGKAAYDHSLATGNAHGLTKADIGLGNVSNTTDADKPLSSAAVTALAAKADLVGGVIPSNQLPSFVDDVLEFTDLAAFPAIGESGKIYVASGSGLTYRWGGSAYVLISSSLALGETAATAYRGDRGKAAYDHSLATGNAHGLTKADLGLGNVSNTADADKPLSSAATTALAAKADLVGGLIPANQLPSYVDDVLEFTNLAAFPATGESGKVYVTLDTNLQYRWGGSSYVPISSSLALGETTSTAYRGDRGKTAYDHSQATGNVHSMTKSDVGLGSVNNTADVDKPISTATATALAAKADLVGGLVPTNQLPSYVDDVVEAATFSSLPVTGESGKIYVTTDTNMTYRWGGSTYAEISSSLALGETSATAYRGDRGKAAYDHSQATGNVHSIPVATVSADGLMSKDAVSKLTSSTVAAVVGTMPAQASRAANTLYVVTTGDVTYAAGSYFWDGTSVWPVGNAGNTVGLSCTIVSTLTAVAAGSDGMFLVSSSSDSDGIYLKVNSSIYCMSGMKGDKGETGATGTTTWAGITDKPSVFTPDIHQHATSDITGLTGLIIALS